MTTKFADTFFEEVNQYNSPVFDSEEWKYQDADDELGAISEFIKNHFSHNANIEPQRIKFFYTMKTKKVGGRYTLGSLKLRDEEERALDENYDFILSVFYPVWKELDARSKVVQLDKILCGIQMEEEKLKKKQSDSIEFVDNLYCFGVEDVIKSTEVVHLSTEQFIEKQKEAKKNKQPQSANDETMSIAELLAEDE
jgi:hypothetical protein